MSDTQLTTGILKVMLSSHPPLQPTKLQVINIKKIKDNFRLFLNDGQYSTESCMVSSQLSSMITNREVDINCIIRVKRYVCNHVKNSAKVLILLDIEVLQPGFQAGGVIGSPVKITGNEDTDNETPSPSTSSQSTVDSSSPQTSHSAENVNPELVSSYKNQIPGINSIMSLTPYQNKWKIRVRITNKTHIQTYSNSKGEGKLFSIDLLDDSGEIQATAFNEVCDKFYDFLQVDKIYEINSADIKIANQKFSTLKNDYEMTFNYRTQINVCENETHIPQLKYDFKPINEIEMLEEDELVDVIGIVKSFNEVKTFISKQNQEYTNRDVQIVDDSGKEIRLTFWGEMAKNLKFEGNPVIAARKVKVGDFNGKTLSLMRKSPVKVNPNIEEATHLKDWFDRTGHNMKTFNLSNLNGGGASTGTSSCITLGDALVEELGTKGTTDYYTTVSYVTHLRNCMYPACPTAMCNKKVIDLNNGMYKCDKCNKEYNSYKWRLMLSAFLTDSTNSVWVTVFHDESEMILGHKVDYLSDLKEKDADTLDSILHKSYFKTWLFKLKVEMEMYNNENRLKTTATKVTPVNYEEYSNMLLSNIEQLTKTK